MESFRTVRRWGLRSVCCHEMISSAALAFLKSFRSLKDRFLSNAVSYTKAPFPHLPLRRGEASEPILFFDFLGACDKRFCSHS